MDQDSYTLDNFEKMFRVQANPLAANLLVFWDEQIGEMKEAGRMSNAEIYYHTKNSVLKFINKNSLHYNEVSPTFLDKYEVFLRSRGGSVMVVLELKFEL